MKRRFLALMLMLCLFAGLPVLAQDAPTSGGTVVGGDDAALRAYIERFVNSSGLSQPFTVTVGSLPEGLPFALTVPEGVRVLGSITRTDAGSQSFEIALDGSTPADVLTFYNAAFSGSEWQVIQADDTTVGGFSTTAGTVGRYCMNGTSVAVEITSESPQPGRNLISINIYAPADPWRCESMLTSSTDNPYAVMALTTLGVPEGVTITNNVGDGLSYYRSSSSSASLNAVIRSDLPIAQIAEGYNSQLQHDYGWTNVMTENGANFAISRWTLTDANGKAWKGTFMLTSTHDAGIYTALLYIED